MTIQKAIRLLNVPPYDIRRVLLDPRALPAWNPAFHTLDGPAHAATGVAYPITVRGGLTGSWEYTAIADQRLDTAWHVPGFRETAVWLLEPHGDGTLVTHEFQHTGPLAGILSQAFRGVAELRLDRLTQRAHHSRVSI